jgi:hypothetical protein
VKSLWIFSGQLHRRSKQSVDRVTQMSFSRASLVGFSTTEVYSGLGADIVVESMHALIGVSSCSNLAVQNLSSATSSGI